MSNSRWTKLIIACWMVVMIASWLNNLGRDFASASRWLVVREIHVYDTWVGDPPHLTVNRDIVRPFHGEWLATVRHVSDGSLAFACLAEGRADYATDARIPPNITLDWWTFPAKCRLAAGQYRLDTQWRIRAQGYPEKFLRASSNVFEVHPRPDFMPPPP